MIRPLLEGSKEAGAWDAEVGGPSAVPMAGGRYRLYYSGRSAAAGGGGSGGPWEGVGLALTPQEPAPGARLFEGMRTDFQRLARTKGL